MKQCISFSERMLQYACVLTLSLCVLFPLVGNAQVIPGLGDVSLITSPEFPSPRESVTVSLNDYSIDSLGTTIVWHVNGVERTGSKNERSIQVTAGDIGEKSVVKVSLLRNGAVAYTASRTVAPSVVHVITEAYTHTPTFYKGRALPSTNASVRVVAFVQDGTKNTPSSYTYKWTHDDTVLFGGPVKGKQSVVTEISHFGDEYLTVEVFNAEGVLVGKGETLLHAVEPELHFYEWSPLRGLVGKEILSPFELFGEEVTVYAEPYYLDARMDGESADFSWKINGTSVPSNEGAPHTLTLMREGESGKSYVEFSAVTKKRMPQFVKYGFEVFFE